MEEYDGTNWTEVTDVNTAKWSVGGSTAGTTTAALKFGGISTTGETEQWNGSSWTEVADMNTTRSGVLGAGTSTAALTAGGEGPAQKLAVSEEWNGSAWAEGNDLNEGVQNALSGAGIQTAAFKAGGNLDGPLSAVTEHYDGTSWSTSANINTARWGGAGQGTQAAGIIFGGAYGTATEEFTDTTSAAEAADIDFD